MDLESQISNLKFQIPNLSIPVQPHVSRHTGAEHVAKLQALGARQFRVEFLDEPPSQVALTIEKYQQLLAGKISGAQLWRELKLLNQLGVTRGPMG